MTIVKEMDMMIKDLKKRKMKPESIIMGRNICITWLKELSRSGDIEFHKANKYNFKHKGIPIVVCDSDILEVVPNAKYLLD